VLTGCICIAGLCGRSSHLQQQGTKGLKAHDPHTKSWLRAHPSTASDIRQLQIHALQILPCTALAGIPEPELGQPQLLR
jgi:hypothetical protein